MKFKNIMTLLVILIVFLAVTASVYGLVSSEGPGLHQYHSIHGQVVSIYGKGLYANDSVTVVAQGKAQDIVTLGLGVPLLLISIYLARKNSLKGQLLLAGTLAYFLYTYISYTFLWMYNPFFLVYVLLMSASFFAFTLLMMSFNTKDIKASFNPKLPIKFLGGFQIFFAFAIGMLWLGMIVPTIINGTVPPGLEHYTTLVIQGMDLGFIVPLAFISGVLLIKQNDFGYLLSSVIIIKGLTMGAALSAMIIGQIAAGVQMSLAQIIIFPLLSVVMIICLFLILKNIDQKKIA
ncbi:hypothetical protein [Desulfitobacterium sp. AusDCA]|uniref:hypothetical protein n=1 Tax=Desulfitobacterium sp. AusDCA TaxID=3240383 RepID=UPI003DA6E241